MTVDIIGYLARVPLNIVRDRGELITRLVQNVLRYSGFLQYLGKLGRLRTCWQPCGGQCEMMQVGGGTDFEMEVQNAGKLGRGCGFARLDAHPI